MTKPMTDNEYVDTGGNLCPYCRGDDLDGGYTEFDSDGATREVSCGDCDKMWTETLRITGWVPR